MSENNEKDIFSKRTNQLKKVKDESLENNNNEITENLIENIIEEDFNISENIDVTDTDYDELTDVYEEVNQNEFINNHIEVQTNLDDLSERNETYTDLEDNDLKENKPKSLLEQFVLNVDDDEIDEHNLDELVSNEREFIDINDESDDNLINLGQTNLESTENENFEEFIEDESEDLMNDLLVDADELLREHKQMVEGELTELNENEEFDINDEDEEENLSSDEPQSLYSDEEIMQRRNTKKPIFSKDLFIKVGVGIAFIIFIIAIALFARRFLNNKNTSNKPNKNNNSIVTETETPTPDVPDISEDDVKVIDDILNDLNSTEDDEDSNEDIVNDIEDIESNTEIPNDINSETSLFIQSFKGYLIDVNESEIYVSNLEYNKSIELLKDFDNYKNSKKDLTDIEMLLGYDYSSNDILKTIIYKKFSISDTSEVPSWATIGSEVSVIYIQDKESLLNELVEIEEYKEIEQTEGTIINPVDTVNVDKPNEDISSMLGDNVWGNDWDVIVSTINDRRNKTASDNVDKNGNVLDLENLELKESVTANIQIGTASIVWFKIGWKSNKDVKNVPNLEDVVVELQTANGSLVNDSNISKYGKKWVSEDKTINFVMKNTMAGNWGIVFTKDVGTYLGDVTIQAVPITGFLQIIDADAAYTDGKLKVIWNTGGVKDDNCKVQIYARNGSKDVLMYSGNSIDDGIHTVDMVEIDTSKIAGNTYDIIIKVTDIDATASTPKTIAATYITDIKVIENIEIPKIQ